MTTQLQTQQAQSNLTKQIDFNPEAIKVIKDSVAKDATDTELQHFLIQCKRTGLDPITRQIYFIKNTKNGRVQIQTSIDGFRLIAERSGVYEGQTAALWCDKSGNWKDVWLDKSNPPSACKIGVFKKGFREALYAVAIFDEYAQQTPVWTKMPSLMLAKVAESLALRKAFPNEMSGLYTDDELPIEKKSVELKSEVKLSAPKQVAPVQTVSDMPFHSEEGERIMEAEIVNTQNNDEVQFSGYGSYKIKFGKHTGKTINDLGEDATRAYFDWLQKSADEKGKKPTGDVKDFMDHAFLYLQEMES